MQKQQLGSKPGLFCHNYEVHLSRRTQRIDTNYSVSETRPQAVGLRRNMNRREPIRHVDPHSLIILGNSVRLGWDSKLFILIPAIGFALIVILVDGLLAEQASAS
jgi:hypothetical protein